MSDPTEHFQRQWEDMDPATAEINRLRDEITALTAERDAIAAAAFETAATCTEWTAWGERHNLTEATRRAIRALTPADAKASLDRMLMEAKSAEVREAEALGKTISI